MRRKWITILRVTRYGVSNFTRNAWLTTAATVVMVVTLTIILATFTMRLVFQDTLTAFRDKIDISVYLCDKQVPNCKEDVSSDQRAELVNEIKRLPFVTNVTYVSKEEAREKFVQDNNTDAQKLNAIATLDDRNPLPASLRVNVNDTNKLEEISKLVGQDKYKTWQAREASISGSRKDAIEALARAAQFSEIAGLATSALFLVLSVMIIFNTIRMAIFNRRDEIEIMKLIGAEKSFIRGPFIVEASLYGIIAAVVSVGLVYAALVFAGPSISSYGIEVNGTIKLFSQWPVAIFLSVILMGILIGIISSFMAMRRYLKV
ncbi:MAG TPA: permease-like cell division protein FtsX [Candidatus Saccharimonadales bacterium]|nr:permease-like cell division protein FtsX [Candidatus Saccharimonadales bacterium]